MEETESTPTEDNNRNIILAVGAAAVILAIILYVALLPNEPQIDPYVVQLESEIEMYTSQIDSMNGVVDGLNSNIDVVRSQMDSARASNRLLLVSLQRITNEMNEFRRLYNAQITLNSKLKKEITQVKAEKDRATAEAKQLKSDIDDLNDQLYDQTVRLTRLQSIAEEAIEKEREWKETAISVLVISGTEDELKGRGYLKTWRAAIFSKNFKVVGFPDVTESSDNGITRVAIGETLSLQGELDAICDRHGKLGKGKEYEVSKGPGKTLITFTDATLEGQRILAVIKK